MNKLIKFIVFEAAMLAGLYVLKNYTEKYMDLVDKDDCESCEDCCCTTDVAPTVEEVEEVIIPVVEVSPVVAVAVKAKANVVEEKPKAKRVVKPRVKKEVVTSTSEINEEEKPKAKRAVKPRVKKVEVK